MKKEWMDKAVHRHQAKKHWQTLVRALAVVVIFCTTYLLVMPAITMDEDPICGMEAHVHAGECWVQAEQMLMNCPIPTDATVIHHHGESCRDENWELICQLPEKSLHTHGLGCFALACPVTHVHTEDCTATELALTCTMEQTPGHSHDESCTIITTVQICGDEEHDHEEDCFLTQTLFCEIPEAEAHSHGAECYTVTEIPCTEATAEDHDHDEGCYMMDLGLICGRKERVLHSHTAECEGADGLICGMEAVVEHTHTAECLVIREAILICEIPEHTHDEIACYPLESRDQEGSHLCGYAVHHHNEQCDEGCTIPEHDHEAACLVADLDLTADVETRADWLRSVSSMTLTGNWPADVLAVAETQLGYKESVKNVILEGNKLKGYTRYGEWYGVPYGDWCAMYASFCLHYAGVQDYPLESGVSRWIEALTGADYYKTPENYTAKPGDLIFFDHDQKRNAEIPVDADHVGIVVELIPADGENPARIKTIEGNISDKVLYMTYPVDDPTIIGYGLVPCGKMFRLTHEGADYTVTVTLGAETGIPETAQLAVREIEAGTREYEIYYQQSLEALMGSGEAEVPQISFARFFDICFIVDGEELEPLAPVDIEIVYSDAIAMTQEETGQIVHFAKDGVEVLNPSTGMTAESDSEEQVDTFQFTQDSFSVSGTLVSTMAANTTATRVRPPEIDNTGNTMYVLYTQIGGKYYALSGAADSYPVEITVNGNNITLPANNTANLFWTFVDDPGSSTDYQYNPIANVGSGRYLHPFNNGANNQNITTGNPYAANLIVSGDTFKIRGANNNFVRFSNATAKAAPTTDQNQATSFYAAVVGTGGTGYNVWFDGTLGGMMSYYGAANQNIPASVGADGKAVVELPETWDSSTKYDYVLRGWYDINTQTYYPVDPHDNIQPTATVSGNTVFYADWIAATYDVGQMNENVVDSLDTHDFVTTHVFDYNVLFNVLSQSHTGTISAGSHTESWTIYNDGEKVPYGGGRSLGFAFVDYDAGGVFSYANNRNEFNYSRDVITYGILDEVKKDSGKDVLDLLFNPETEVIGKYYAGTGNYLFQYMDSTTSNYDGEHDGYYYLDSRLNAASYNQTEQRFYIYNYLERTSDSRKDGGAGQYSDLLPFNSPYIFKKDQVDEYTDSIRRPGYEYDAKDGASSFQEYNSTDDATTNYFFGLRTDIEFFLPNDAGTKDEYGNYGNTSTRGEHMVFEFHGDDDVWVFVDGKLMLDIGGLHGIMHGHIDFSTGTISYGENGTDNVSTFKMAEGTHTMTVYYMERGSSQSNCAIYFNIAPRYDLEITKEDIVTASFLDGAVFSIFNDEAGQDPAELWNSFAEHESGAPATNQFTVQNGVAKCWGISAGKTYYIRETTPPPGYPASDDMIRITLNNRGTATIETTTLHGDNGIATEGFAVIKQNVNDTLKIVALTLTNQLEGDTTEVRVEKIWDENSVNLPAYITVYLTADGQRIGRSARLTEANGWSYTWTGLPKYRTEGVDEEVVYVVEEVFVPDYITVQGESVKVENYVDWVRVDQMSDSKTFLLVHNGKALTCNGNTFGWIDRVEAESDSNRAAHWQVTTDHDGFHLKNELGYTLTYGNGKFYGVNNDSNSLNQVFYYLNSRLMVHDHDVYYQFGTNGTAVQADGLAFQLYQKETLTGLLTNIVNRPVDEEKQTFVEVSKVWNDGADKHARESVTVRLYADGKDTGRYLILNASNNWSGSFDDLPYYHDGSETKIVYTVVEDEVRNYIPEYSEGKTLAGRPVSFWKNKDTITAGGGNYRIYANGYALAVAADNDATTAPNDLEDEAQQWVAIAKNNGVILKNVATSRYLQLNNNDLTTTNREAQATVITISNGYLMLGTKYLELGAAYAGVTDSAANANRESLRITQWSDSSGMPGVGYTITNKLAMYELPATGSRVTDTHVTFGGLLMAAAVLMYIQFGHKRQRGGRKNG